MYIVRRQQARSGYIIQYWDLVTRLRTSPHEYTLTAHRTSGTDATRFVLIQAICFAQMIW